MAQVRFKFGSSSVQEVSVLGSCRGSCSPVMPLSSEQKGMLKDPTTRVKFEQENPKSPGSKAYQRYDKYKGSTTIQDATQNGANWQDITVDFEKGWLVVEGFTGVMEVDEAGGAKRTHPEGTPDREASTRARPHAREAPPTTLSNRPNNAEIETHKVEMSAATMAAFRMMMREEIAVIEEAITNKVHNSIQDIKEELKQEKEARMKLEERITKLEEGKGAQRSNLTLEDAELMEKDKVVIGGFTELDGEEAGKLVDEVLANCPGFEGAYATNPTPTVVMAKFNTAGMAMKMIKNQKFNPKMKENKLWASENRSPTERRQCKLVSKLKKFLIEHDKQDPKNVIVSYKWFHVRVRNGRTFAHVATVNEDGEVQWAEDIGQVSATVKECMAEFEANME